MNCEQIQSSLVAYLDGEVTPSERTLIQAHLSNCTDCQQELSLLYTARSQVRSMLQRRAVHALPSQKAWNRLEAKLTEAEQLSSKKEAWFSRRAPNGNRASNPHKKFGGVSMNKRSIFSAAVGVLVLAVLAVVIARNVTPASASAREILDRASEVQAQSSAAQGIRYIRNEEYGNLEARSDGEGLGTIIDSYFDSATGDFRVVATDQKTGKVLQVFAFDGSYAYNSGDTQDGQPGEGPLTVYRSVQAQMGAIAQKLSEKQQAVQGGDDAKFMFEKMRQDPQVELVGQETWDNGHTVYVLRSQQEIKLMVENEITHPTGTVTFYFDANTYQQLGVLVTMAKDGKEVVVKSQRVLTDEVLSEGSQIAWDLSDLQGIHIVDDPTGEHSPEIGSNLTAKDLAAQTDSAYLLKTTPNGFSLEINVNSRQKADEQFIYEATYTDQAGDTFTVRTLGKPLEDTGWADETYTTANGLVLYFGAEGEKVTSAFVVAPNGKTYAIDSTLPRDQIKALAEELVLVK